MYENDEQHLAAWIARLAAVPKNKRHTLIRSESNACTRTRPHAGFHALLTCTSLSHVHRDARMCAETAMRLRHDSWILMHDTVGPLVERRLRRSWAFAAEQEGLAWVERRDLMERSTQQVWIPLGGMDPTTSRKFMVSLGIDGDVATDAVLCRMTGFYLNPRLVADVPICDGTLNLAWLQSLGHFDDDDEQEHHGTTGLKSIALLMRHMDGGDAEDHLTINDVSAENMRSGHNGVFEADASTDEMVELNAQPGTVVRCEERAPRFRDPARDGVALISPPAMMAVTLKERAHTVLEAIIDDASKEALRAGAIHQNNGPFLGQARRSDETKEGFLPMPMLQTLTLCGELPYSEHDVKCVDDEAKFKRSRWPSVTSYPDFVAIYEQYVGEGEVNYHSNLKRTRRQQRVADMWKAVRPVAIVDESVRELARIVGVSGEQLEGALHATLPARKLVHAHAAAEALLRHAKHQPVANEEQAVGLLTALLTCGGSVDSLLLSFLDCREAHELSDVLVAEEVDHSNAYMPCVFPGDTGPRTRRAPFHCDAHSSRRHTAPSPP